MRKSFTRLLSLVMCLLLFSYISMAAVEGIDAKAVWPKDDGAAKAYTKITDKILVIYSEAVTAGTGSVRVLDASDNVLAVLPGSDSRISYAKGDTVAIDLSATLKELTAYTVNIDGGAFKTVKDGTASLDENFVFTTGDYTAPKLKAVEPEKGTVLETNTGNNLKVTFSDLSVVSKGKGTVAVYKADGNLWDLIDVATRGSVAEVDGDYVLTLTGVRTLEDNTSYAVTISSGVVEDEGLTSDESKNVYGGLTDRTVWTFSTVDFSAPTYATGYPKKSNVGNESFDVLVKTNEAGTAYGIVLAADADAPTAAEIREDANVVDVDVVGGTEATLSFDGLEEATDYVAYVVVDNDDIEGTVVKSVAVTTSETEAPKLVTVTYDYATSADDTEGVSGTNIVDENTSVNQDLKTIVLTFNEEVKLGVGSIIIKKVLDNSVFKTINSADMTLSDDKMSVKFSLSGLGNNVKYYAIIPGTLVLDAFDNKYAGISTVTGWRFNSSDDIAPTYTVVPAHAATNVKKDAKIVITFDEVVSASASDFDLSYDSEDESIDFSYAQNDNDGKYTVITLTPAAELPSGQLVQLLVYEGSITDLAGNYVGLEVDDTKGYSFFVEDHAGPTIKSWTATPLTSETATVKITYNEGIRLLGGTEITAANLPYILTVKKTDASGSNVAVTYSIDDAKKVISITPATKWESEGTYYFAVSSDVEDMAGNEFVGDDASRSLVYTVNDLVAETVAINVADKTISTGDAITVKFNEATPTPAHTEARAKFSVAGTWVDLTDVAQMNQVIVLKEGSATGPNIPFTVGGTNGDFTVTASLEGNKTYYIGVGPSTKDAAGNVNVANFVTFKTKFEDEPELVSVTPADGATQVAKTSNFVLTFNTGVKLSSTYATGDVYFSLDNGATSAKAVAASEITFNTDGTVATINPAGDNDLATDKIYDLIVGSGAFQNKNTPNVGFGGIAANAWDFATTDTQIEVATLNNDEAIDVAIDDDFVLTFDEKIVVGSGNIDIKNFNTDAVVERIAVGSSNVTIDAADDETTITINPTNLLKYNTKYYIEVDAGAFKDVAGNASKEIYGKTTARGVYDWVVTTANVDLAITKVTPANGSDKISSTSSIVVEFNRDIKAGAGQIGYIEQNNETGVTQDQKFAIGSSNLSFSGNKLTIIHPEKVFPANTKIWLYIGAGAVAVSTEEANVNDEVSNTTVDTWSFNTGDVNAPKPTFDPVAFVDEDGKRVYVSVNKAITVSFDEDIFHKVDGTVFTSGDITDDNVFQLFKGNVNDTEVSFVGSISGRTVTMTPDVALDQFAEYTIVINNFPDGDGVMDNKNHVTPYTTVKFVTTDLTAPTVSLTATGADKKVVLSGITVTDPNASKFYYLVRAKSVSAAPSVADIKAANAVKVADLGADIEVKDLAPSTTYEVFYVADDTFGNTSSVAKKEASTTDTVAPLLTSTDPANNAVDVNITDAGAVVIKLNFNENVVKGTGAIVLREQVTQTIFGTYDAASVLAAGADSKKLVLTLTGISTSADAQKFYVEMAQGSVVDGAANAFAGLFGSNGIFFTTEDNSKPTFTHDDADHIIATNENIKIKFSEAVKAGTGTAILYKGSVATANAVQVFNASDVTFSGTSVTVNPTADLANNQTYVLVVNANFALDLSSNKNGNAANQFTFSVSENVAPSVVAFWPAEPVSGVYNKSALHQFDFDFTEDLYFEIDGISLSRLYLTDAQIKANGILSVVDENGVAIPYEMYQCCSNDFTFYLDTDLLGHNKKYTVTIKGLTDIDGLVMTPYSHTFVTSDGVRPVAVFNPADEAENVIESGKLTMTFNEQIYHSVQIIDGDNFYYEPFTNTNVDNVVYLKMYDGDGWEDVDFDATFNGTNTITITPAEALVSGAEYKYGFLVGGVVDGDDQVTDDDNEAIFTVRDYKVPTFDIANVSPAKKATGVLANAKMSVIFSEPIVVSTGKVIIRNLDGTIFQTIDATGLSVDADNSAKLNIAHNNFAVKAEYFVELEASVITDKSGNPNKAYSDAVNGWLFTTKDTYSIEATVTPTGDNNQRVVNLEMNFNKNVQPNSDGDFGYFLTVYKEDGTAVKQIDAADLVVLNKKVTFFNLELDANQRYYARVEPGAFVDESDNSFAGIMDDSWTFSTIDNIAPKVVTLSPADDSKAVDTQTSSLVMTFDRNIALGTGTIAVRYAVDGKLFEEVSVANAVVNASAKSLTINLTKVLDSNTAFYVIVPAGAVTNTESTKDAFAGILNTYTWNFTTSTDLTAPKLVTWTPNATTTTDNDPTYVLTFDENVVLGAGNLKIYKKSDNALALTIPVTATMVNGKVVTVKNTYNATTNNGLDKNTDYYVLVDAGLVKDAAGNASAAVSDVAAWTFKTGADFATVIDTPIDNSLAFKVYPNPFVDDVTVETSFDLTKVVVTNIAGQVVKQVVNPTGTIQLNELRSGVYFMALYQGDKVAATVKIVKR